MNKMLKECKQDIKAQEKEIMQKIYELVGLVVFRELTSGKLELSEKEEKRIKKDLEAKRAKKAEERRLAREAKKSEKKTTKKVKKSK